MAKYIDPFTDTGFKIIFGKEHVSNDILRNATLSPEDRSQYDYDLKKARDYHAEMAYARKEATTMEEISSL